MNKSSPYCHKTVIFLRYILAASTIKNFIGRNIYGTEYNKLSGSEQGSLDRFLEKRRKDLEGSPSELREALQTVRTEHHVTLKTLDELIEFNRESIAKNKPTLRTILSIDANLQTLATKSR